MQNRDILKLATRIFRTNRLRTVLTILGIGVGIGAIVFLVSLGFGLQRLLLSQITSSDALLSLTVTTSDPESIPLDKEFLKKVKTMESVEEIRPVANFPSQIILNQVGTNVAVKAIDPTYFRLAATQVQVGKLFEENEENKIVLSSAVLQALNIDSPEAVINQKVSLDIFLEEGVLFKEAEATPAAETTTKESEQFLVSGIVQDDIISFAYIPISRVEDIEVKNFEEVKVKVKESKLLEPVRDEIIKMGLMVTSLSDTIRETSQVFRIIQTILALFGAVALLVAAIGMFNTMTISLLERTHEIGIMKALGATNQDIKKIFLAESMIVGFLGGTSGVVIGRLGGKLVNLTINFLATRLGGQSLSIFYFPPAFVVFIIAFSTLVGFLTGLYPAKRASSLNPLDALRYK